MSKENFTMKRICLALCASLFSFSAAADCLSFGDARGSSDEGVLCEFGDSDSDFPTGNAHSYQPKPTRRTKHQEGILTPQEEWNVIRSLTTRYRGANDGSLRGAIRGGTMPLGFIGKEAPLVR